LTLLLSAAPELQVLPAASSAEVGIRAFRDLRPALVLLDLELPKGSAIHLLQQIRLIDADCPVILLATYPLDSATAQALACGGAACVVLAKDQVESLLIPLLLRLAQPGSPERGI
jgi:DNA-binding NarL/FixJ family response regulator